MHTFGESGAGVPAFLAKLWRLVEDPETNHLIYWSRDGRSFVIQNQAQFARELLPLNYKHNNMASFIRQLNMYGFHKITSIDNGGLKFDRDEMEFSHPYFKRGCPHLLEHIKRKIANQKTTIDERSPGMKTEAVNKVLSEVKLMRGRQDSLDSRFSVMKQENEALWREIASLRQKHMKQQQIVNKLIQFLVTIVQPSRNMSGVKRHFQLMINDVPQSSSKMRKRSESDSGPVIHELTEELLDEVADSDAELLISSSPHVLSPGSANNAESETLDEHCPNSTLERPSSTHSTFSQPYDSNQSDDINLQGTQYLQTKYDGGINAGGNTADSNEEVVFEISEIPENANNAGGGFIDNDNYENQLLEENVLKTPLVKQEIAGNSGEHQRQKQKRVGHLRSGISQKRSKSTRQQQQRRQQQQQQQSQQESLLTASQIKTEKDLDQLIFLQDEDEQNPLSMDPNLISPNTNSSNNNQQLTEADIKQMYNSGDFLNTEMPADLFEESSMMDDINLVSGTYNPNTNINNTTTSGGQLAATTATATSPSPTSTTTGTSATSTIVTNKPVTQIAQKRMFQNNDDSNNLTLAKYNNQKLSPEIHEDIMRLSTPEDFNGHLDSVQGDLDSLKDILRGDSYSLDANTLMGKNASPGNRIFLSSPLDGDILAKLFSDSDILAPYGLSLSTDAFQDKKGSELMTYNQPCFSADFSDILDINNENVNQDEENNVRSPEPPSSVLNTPYPERD